jgi:transposase
MRDWHLSRQLRNKLRKQLRQTKEVFELRRAIALLAMDDGMAANQAAQMVGVTRQCIYQWQARLKAESNTPDALAQQPRSGRPSRWDEDALAFLQAALHQAPDQLGYPATGRTVGLLQEHLQSCLGERLSEETMRRQLHRLGYVWKRPRYVLDPDPQREKKTRFAPVFQKA